jgi:hypothetical protein
MLHFNIKSSAWNQKSCPSAPNSDNDHQSGYYHERGFIGDPTRSWSSCSDISHLHVCPFFAPLSNSEVALTLAALPGEGRSKRYSGNEPFQPISSQISFFHPEFGAIEVEYGNPLINDMKSNTSGYRTYLRHTSSQKLSLTCGHWIKNMTRKRMELPKHWFEIFGEKISVRAGLHKELPTLNRCGEIDCWEINPWRVYSLFVTFTSISLPNSPALRRLFAHHIAEPQVDEGGRESCNVEKNQQKWGGL